jgi:formate hydrogenlyase subunit 6/NADH:ubiquinone oxidoreductase subunit I
MRKSPPAGLSWLRAVARLDFAFSSGGDMSFFRVNDKCNGCLACVQNCPAQALSYEDRGTKRTLLHSILRCARCGHCWRICPQRAIEFQHLLEGGWEEVVSMDLVRCSVCGEPIYTSEFEKTLAQRLKQEVETLCPRHRAGLSLTAWHQALSEGHRQESIEK